MSGSVMYQQWVMRSDLVNNPNALYLFGDNVDRLGLGGQAKEMRGERNAVGVATKWEPYNSPDSFFLDKDITKTAEIVLDDLRIPLKAVAAGIDRIIVIPTDGLGTGLSQLNKYSPTLDRFLKGFLDNFIQIAYDLEYEARSPSFRDGDILNSDVWEKVFKKFKKKQIKKLERAVLKRFEAYESYNNAGDSIAFGVKVGA